MKRKTNWKQRGYWDTLSHYKYITFCSTLFFFSFFFFSFFLQRFYILSVFGEYNFFISFFIFFLFFLAVFPFSIFYLLFSEKIIYFNKRFLCFHYISMASLSLFIFRLHIHMRSFWNLLPLSRCTFYDVINT